MAKKKAAAPKKAAKTPKKTAKSAEVGEIKTATVVVKKEPAARKAPARKKAAGREGDAPVATATAAPPSPVAEVQKSDNAIVFRFTSRATPAPVIPAKAEAPKPQPVAPPAPPPPPRDEPRHERPAFDERPRRDDREERPRRDNRDDRPQRDDRPMREDRPTRDDGGPRDDRSERGGENFEHEFEPGDNIGNRAGVDTHERTADRGLGGPPRPRGDRFGRGPRRDRFGRGPRDDRGPRNDRGPRDDRGPRNDRGPAPRGPEFPPRGGADEARGGPDQRPREDGEGGGRRRRRRRRGRGRGGEDRGMDRGPGGAPAGPRDEFSPRDEHDAFDAPPVDGPRDADMADRGGAPAGPMSDIDAEAERNLSPSQKRRLRRRRARERRMSMGGQGGEPGSSPDAIDREDDRLGDHDAAGEFEPRGLEADLDEADEPSLTDRVESFDEDVEIDDRAPEDIDDADDADDDDLADDEADGSIELGEGVPELEPDGAAMEEVPDADGGREDRGGRRGRRGRRDRRGMRGRRNFAESPDADSRVFGQRGEETVYEVEPEESEVAGIGTELERAETSVADSATASGRKREMIINIARGEECRIAILEDGRLEQIYLERASAESHVGNIYKGVVTNVEASIQAAFIDFGLGKNGFLHISDLHPMYFPGGEDRTENVGRKLPRKNRPPIQRCLRRGQELIVQITKEGIGTKGPTLTTYLSVPGRFLVMMPGMGQLGVSRKIEDEETRRRVKSVLNELELPEDIGFIARTAAEGRSKKELQADLNYLTRLWRVVEKRSANEKAPCEVYRDSDLVIRTIRDVYTADVERILIDDADVAARAQEFLGIFSQNAAETVVHYDEAEPIFHRFGIEAELERLHSRHVPLRSGGSLVIDQTEALVAIDVNSGRFRAEDDAESTAFRMNMEAADEIPRQLRLRDLGGVIICDFIDMRREENRREVERRLIKNLKQHKERAKVLRMSQFGIIEMTRQRQRGSLTRSVYQDCHHCRGTGLIKTAESVALDVMRLVTLASTREHIRSIEVGCSPEVAYMLQNRKRAAVYDLEARYRRSISIRPDAAAGLDQVNIQCFDHRGRLVPHH